MLDDDNRLPNGTPSETEDIVDVSMGGYSKGTWDDLQTLKTERSFIKKCTKHRRGNKQHDKIT